MAAHRSTPPLIARSQPSLGNLCDPGGFAWEILRRRADYQPDAGKARVDRVGRGKPGVEFLTSPAPDPSWGLQFRGKPRSPGRARSPLLASRSRSVGDRRRCHPDATRRARCLRPFCATRPAHASFDPPRRRTSAIGTRSTLDPFERCDRHAAQWSGQACLP